MTDLRRGFTGVSAPVQTALKQDAFAGRAFVFRGGCGDLTELLWRDGDRLRLFARRLERRRIV